ncbi:MAG: ABC transporter permease [Chloroflexi bacterium]|nr:ABC transporter permease [Chloroflexota bacterium]MCC6891833.1 ABC transporter permease [Anaerolineae bacterium]
MISMFIENLRLSIGEIFTNKLRAFLTVLGITIGIAAVVLLMSLGQSVQAYVSDQFASLGANTIRVSARPSNGRTVPLTETLAETLKDSERLPSVGLVMATVSGSYSVLYEGNQFTVNVTGVTTDYLDIEGRTVETGRFFSSDDYNASTQVAIIGTTTVENLFDTEDPIGKTIRIDNILVQVIGVFEESGTNDDLIVIPFTTFKDRLKNSYTADGQRTVDTILVQAIDTTQVEAATTELETVLRQERDVGTGDTDNFNVFTASTIVSSLNSTIEVLTIFLGIVAGISLLVGGINIMNIMLVAITERTREIGLRKAVGAQYIDIVVLFLIQAIVLTLLGGLIGVLIAWGGAVLISALVPDFTVTIQTANIIFAVTISTLIGLFFGVYPASRAAQLNPIDALRYE